MAGPTTEILSTDLKALTREVADFRAEFAGFQGRVENFFGRAETIFGFLRWLGGFLAVALLGLVGTSLRITWDASKLDARTLAQSDRLDRLERAVERIAGSVEILAKASSGKRSPPPEKPPGAGPGSSLGPVPAPRQLAQVRRIDTPQGSQTLGVLDSGGVLQFEGIVKEINIEGIDRNTTVDMSRLVAETVTIGRVDGVSCVLVNAKGNVTFTGKIDGRSWAAVRAGGDVTIDGKIKGMSRVRVKAGGTVHIGEKIDGGPCTALIFSATSHFEIKGMVEGGAVLEEKVIAENDVFNLRSYPFNFPCEKDVADYPKPKIPDSI